MSDRATERPDVKNVVCCLHYKIIDQNDVSLETKKDGDYKCVFICMDIHTHTYNVNNFL